MLVLLWSKPGHPGQLILTKEVLPLEAFGFTDKVYNDTKLDKLYVLHGDGELTKGVEA